MIGTFSLEHVAYFMVAAVVIEVALSDAWVWQAQKTDEDPVYRYFTKWPKALVYVPDVASATIYFILATVAYATLVAPNVSVAYRGLPLFIATFVVVQWISDFVFYKTNVALYDAGIGGWYSGFWKEYGAKYEAKAIVGDSIYGVSIVLLAAALAAYSPLWLTVAIALLGVWTMVVIAHARNPPTELDERLVSTTV
jgi:hypothetical protein